MTEFYRDYCLALADCLDKPEAPDGTFLGLTDSALAAKALRLFASGRAEVVIPAPLTSCPKNLGTAQRDVTTFQAFLNDLSAKALRP